MPIRVASLCLTAVLAVATAARAAEPVSFSGVYPHLAALSTSYSEAGIGALVALGRPALVRELRGAHFGWRRGPLRNHAGAGRSGGDPRASSARTPGG